MGRTSIRGNGVAVYITPDERAEGVQAYADKLSQEQLEEIDDAPESAIIKITWDFDGGPSVVTVIEEG
jgi:hypothetical protein